ETRSRHWKRWSESTSRKFCRSKTGALNPLPSGWEFRVVRYTTRLNSTDWGGTPDTTISHEQAVSTQLSALSKHKIYFEGLGLFDFGGSGFSSFTFALTPELGSGTVDPLESDESEAADDSGVVVAAAVVSSSAALPTIIRSIRRFA